MATKFNLKDPNPGAWFPFDESAEDSGRICIRALTPRKLSDIRKQTTKQQVEYKIGKRFEYVDVNDEEFSRLIWDYVIADWEKLEDEEGEPIECTTENKYKLMMENVGFARFVAQCRDRIDSEVEGQRQREEGN